MRFNFMVQRRVEVDFESLQVVVVRRAGNEGKTPANFSCSSLHARTARARHAAMHMQQVHAPREPACTLSPPELNTLYLG